MIRLSGSGTINRLARGCVDISRHGGIGRHKGLKIPRLWRPSSSLGGGTKLQGVERNSRWAALTQRFAPPCYPLGQQPRFQNHQASVNYNTEQPGLSTEK